MVPAATSDVKVAAMRGRRSPERFTDSGLFTPWVTLHSSGIFARFASVL
jgi:hypothetical protein